jgi:hypothetical protein
MSAQHLLTFLKTLANISISRYLVLLFRFSTLVAFAIICISVLYYLVAIATSPTYRYLALYSVVRSLGYPEDALEKRGIYPPQDHSRELEDLYNVVVQDHDAISERVQTCMRLNPSADLPRAVEYEFETGVEKRHDFASGGKWPAEIRPLNRWERLLLQLSDQISEQRVKLMGKVRSSYFFWEVATIVSILVGMITTILVSLSSINIGAAGRGRHQIIRVLAIVFPVLGTATAAVIGFYSPQAAWAHASRTLASLTQLHGQIALTVWRLPCPEVDAVPSSPWVQALNSWSDRYIDIQTISNASGEAGGNQSSGGKGGDRQGGGKDGGRQLNGGQNSGSQPNGNQPNEGSGRRGLRSVHARPPQ